MGIRFLGYKGDKIHVKGPGEQWEWQPQGPGQEVIHVSDACLKKMNYSLS